jgi:hypothetical protein
MRVKNAPPAKDTIPRRYKEPPISLSIAAWHVVFGWPNDRSRVLKNIGVLHIPLQLYFDSMYSMI